jgi:hypothetical protein
MIKFFSKSYFSRYAWLLALVVLCWLPQFIHPGNVTGYQSFIFSGIQSALNQVPYISVILTFLVYVFSIFFINVISIEHHISGKVNTLPILMYILYTATISMFFVSNSFIWIGLILLFMLRYCFSLYQSESSIKNAFNAGFLLGVASYFYPPLVYLFLLIWLALMLHRVNTWRAYVSSLLGLLAPLAFLLIWFFLTDQFISSTTALLSELVPVFILKVDASWPELVVFTLMILLGVIFSVQLSSSLSEKSINLRRNLFITLLFFYILFAIIIFYNKMTLAWMLPGIPLAIITAHQLVLVKKTKWINIFLILVVLFVIGNHLMMLLNVN